MHNLRRYGIVFDYLKIVTVMDNSFTGAYLKRNNRQVYGQVRFQVEVRLQGRPRKTETKEE